MTIGNLRLRSAGSIGGTAGDAYGRAEFAAALADVIDAADPDGPVVLGVNGRFGEGKSSVLSMLAASLENRRKYRIVWVSAWYTQGADQLLSAILFRIAMSIRADWAGSWASVVWARAKRISFPVLFAILFPPLLGIAIWATRPEKLGDISQVFSGDIAKLTLPVVVSTAFALIARSARPLANALGNVISAPAAERAGALSHFAEEIDIYASSLPNRGRFVIMLEDLDRCAPARVLEMVNAISQISTHPMARYFCFVIAFDYKVVRDRLAEALREGQEESVLATKRAAEHLQKTFTLSLNLPPPKMEWKQPKITDGARAYLASGRWPLLDAAAIATCMAWALAWAYSGFGPAPQLVLIPLMFMLLFSAARLLSWVCRSRKSTMQMSLEIDNNMRMAFNKLLPENLRERVVATNHAIAAYRLWEIYEGKSPADQWKILSLSAFMTRFGQLARPENLKAGPMSFREGADEFINAGAFEGRSLHHCRDPEMIAVFHRIFAALSEVVAVPPRLAEVGSSSRHHV